MERISASFEGFGYEEELPIPEVHKQGNPEKDMLRILECTRDQIATNLSQINQNTKAYIGQLEPGIFQKFPDNLEQIYTSFPEKKIRRETVEIGGKTAKQLLSELKKAKIEIYEEAKFMLNSKEFVPGKHKEDATLIHLTLGDLGFKKNPTTDEIYKRAQELGLELCPADTGPNYRLQYKNQPLNDWVIIAMKQIADSRGRPSVFFLERRDGGLWLHGLIAKPDDVWGPADKLVFRLRKSKT